MKSKRLYLLSIFYIVIFTIVFKWLYPELEVTSVITVIALLGFVVGLGTHFLITRIQQSKGKNDGTKNDF